MGKTILKIVGALLAGVILLLIGTYGYIFGLNQAARSGPALGEGIEEVADGFATTYLFELSNGKVALIDAGNDPSAAPILQALQKRGKSADDVAAIFITHAHADHDAGVTMFPKAEVFAMQAEVSIADASEPYGSPLHRVAGPVNQHPFKVTHPLHDEETVSLDNLSITAYAVPGHTPGSALYLARGVLFLGDAASIGRSGKMRPPVWLFSRDAEQGIASLGAALDKLTPRAAEIRRVTSSHSGNVEGPAGLLALRDLTAGR